MPKPPGPGKTTWTGKTAGTSERIRHGRERFLLVRREDLVEFRVDLLLKFLELLLLLGSQIKSALEEGRQNLARFGRLRDARKTAGRLGSHQGTDNRTIAPLARLIRLILGNPFSYAGLGDSPGSPCHFRWFIVQQDLH